MTAGKHSAMRRIQRYRERRRRLDYYPAPDVLAILLYRQSTGPEKCLAGIMDDLIRQGFRVSGNIRGGR